mgnify:CR=1 FL=1
MKTKIKKQPIGADETVVIHPHNDALKIIDEKIQKLVQTYDHILKSRSKNSGNRQPTTNIITSNFSHDAEMEMKLVSSRLKSLESSRKMLWEFGTMEVMNKREIK